tara:strand:+ start:869 stop:1177 length:309 start_codon:yes stop_codon:yes gene_type:complete
VRGAPVWCGFGAPPEPVGEQGYRQGDRENHRHPLPEAHGVAHGLEVGPLSVKAMVFNRMRFSSFGSGVTCASGNSVGGLGIGLIPAVVTLKSTVAHTKAVWL